MKSAIFTISLLTLVLLGGCKTSYRWTSTVPENMRSVFVPVFRNDSETTELGSVTATQVAREFQREGTFKVATAGNAALEIQGVIREAKSGGYAGNRRSGARLMECVFTMTAEVSVVDRVNGKVLINNRVYIAQTTFVTNQDRLTGERNASGRLAEDLARQIVDDVTAMQW